MDLDVEHDKHDEKQTRVPSSTTETQHSDGISILCEDSDKDDKYAVCRVCQCAESDRRGDVALGFLNIFPPLKEDFETNESDGIGQVPAKSTGMESKENNFVKNSGFVEFISPNGEVFACKKDLEAGSCYEQDMLVNLGCSCKSDLALAHYACALKWFINRGSLICEICETEVGNIRAEDFKRVLASLKEYESLKERTATGECSRTRMETNSVVDPDAVAAIRRQRLSEISLWFVPHNNSTTTFQLVTDQSVVFLPENASLSERSTTSWAVDGTGILVATGLLTVTLAWLIAPHVGKKTAKNGLHILLGGICALTVVIFLRFVVLSRIKYGPARYWAILFVFWFLVFGVWASRTHGAHST